MDELLELFETGVAEKFQKCTGLPSRNDEAVDGIELFGAF